MLPAKVNSEMLTVFPSQEEWPEIKIGLDKRQKKNQFQFEIRLFFSFILQNGILKRNIAFIFISIL